MSIKAPCTIGRFAV